MKSFEQRKKDILEKAQNKKKVRNRWIAAGTSLAVCVALALVLFIPYSTFQKDTPDHSRNPYYQVIQKIKPLVYKSQGYENNFQAILGAFGNLMGDKQAGADMAPSFEMAPASPDNDLSLGSPEASPDASYVEVTDNQTQGVIEADLFKRSDRYVYFLNFDNSKNNIPKLDIYTIAQADSGLVGSFHLWNELPENVILLEAQLYLSQDCKTVTVVMNYYNQSQEENMLLSLNVEDPANIDLSGKLSFAGNGCDIRMVDGDFLVVYSCHMRSGQVDFDKEETYLPQYTWMGKTQSYPAEDIYVPEEVSNIRYSVVCKVDGKTLEVRSSRALLDHVGVLYVAQDNLYIAKSSTSRENQEEGLWIQKAVSQILGISYGSGNLEILGSIQLPGRVENQYWMDETDGILRVVTETDMRSYYQNDKTYSMGQRQRNADLFCVDLKDWSVAGSVEAFAPEGEDVTSVRFEGKNAYVCTAEKIQLTDPVYFFDLSDPKNITFKDTGTIDGYSDHLVDFKDGTLLGIGMNENRELKIEIYREGETGVDSLCSFEMAGRYATEYKAFFIDREKGYVGFGIWENDSGVSSYYLLQFDGESFNIVLVQDMDANPNNVRAFMDDNWFYMLDSDLRANILEETL